jgi:hypothetical protein
MIEIKKEGDRTKAVFTYKDYIIEFSHPDASTVIQWAIDMANAMLYKRKRSTDRFVPSKHKREEAKQEA